MVYSNLYPFFLQGEDGQCLALLLLEDGDCELSNLH